MHETGLTLEEMSPLEKTAVISYRRIAGRGITFLSDDFILATCYYLGLFGLPKDHHKYFDVAKRASERGDANAIASMARDYFVGLPLVVKKNPELGLKMLQEAVLLQGARAKTLLGYCYEEGIEGLLEKDTTRSRALYEEALVAGDGKAAYYLGCNLHYGTNGFAKDYIEARKYYQRSAELGSAEGKGAMGTYHSEGYGALIVDKAKANESYKEAIILGDKGATEYNFGINCYFGDGIEKNIPLALFHLSNAFKKDPEYNFLIQKMDRLSYSVFIRESEPLPREKCLDANQIITIINNFSGERISEDSSTLIYDVVKVCRNNLSLQDMVRINQALRSVPRIDDEKNASVIKISKMIERGVEEVDVISPLARLGSRGVSGASHLAGLGSGGASGGKVAPSTRPTPNAEGGKVTVLSPLAAALLAAKSLGGGGSGAAGGGGSGAAGGARH